MAKLNHKTRDQYGLTHTQRVFADHYILSNNGAESARIAGYADKTARRKAVELLDEDVIVEYIKMRREQMSEEKIAKAEEVLEFLSDVMRNDYAKAKASRPFIPRDRIQCAELLGKRYALWVDKVESKTDITITVDIED